MISANLNMNMNGGVFASITSMSQIMTPTSKIDIVELSDQNPMPVFPRVPGLGKDCIVDVAPDFDAPLELAVGM